MYLKLLIWKEKLFSLCSWRDEQSSAGPRKRLRAKSRGLAARFACSANKN